MWNAYLLPFIKIIHYILHILNKLNGKLHISIFVKKDFKSHIL